MSFTPTPPPCESVCRMQMIRDPDIQRTLFLKLDRFRYKVYRREFLNLLKHVFAYILTGVVGVEFGFTLWNSFVWGKWPLIYFNVLQRLKRLSQRAL